MKNILLLGFLISTFSSFAQDDELNKLKENKSLLESKIESLEDSLKVVKQEINKLESENIRQLAQDSTLIGIVKNNAKLKEEPSPLGDLIATLNEEDTVYILDYTDNYFGVCSENYCGYMNELWIKKNNQISQFIKVKNTEAYELEKLKEEQEKKAIAAEQAKLDKKYREKYGPETYKKLKSGYYWLEMTKEMAIISLGYPLDINKTVGSWGVREQWVYDDIYLYFKNGYLSSFQN
jgi:predicted nuclease with TOPRIM domain